MSGTPMAGFTATSPYILKAAACGEVGTERGTYGAVEAACAVKGKSAAKNDSIKINRFIFCFCYING
ncbi:hypothetical protein M082_2017 [Bacteroides fragilis str. 3725 D9 ii]|nr:hypothetical protein M082_2017 [Bacteroides fragilis str. 3725 D9 ii]